MGGGGEGVLERRAEEKKVSATLCHSLFIFTRTRELVHVSEVRQQQYGLMGQKE